jgi:hypothetical protein
MSGELIADPAAGNNYARLSVPAQKHTQPSSVEMEFAGVPAAGERVPHDDKLELTPLEDVGGVDDDLIDRESGSRTGTLEPGADVVSLIAVRDTDRDIAGL